MQGLTRDAVAVCVPMPILLQVSLLDTHRLQGISEIAEDNSALFSPGSQIPSTSLALLGIPEAREEDDHRRGTEPPGEFVESTDQGLVERIVIPSLHFPNDFSDQVGKMKFPDEPGAGVRHVDQRVVDEGVFGVREPDSGKEFVDPAKIICVHGKHNDIGLRLRAKRLEGSNHQIRPPSRHPHIVNPPGWFKVLNHLGVALALLDPDPKGE
jgi:hypothetical protein